MTEDAKPAMPPLYKRPEPLAAEKHDGLVVAPNETFGFARDLNACALALSELPIASRDYPIVFSGEGEEIQPTAILGLGAAKNAFVDEAGNWQEGAHIPAYVRRYPFIFVEDKEKGLLTLCVDMDADTVGANEGMKLFEDGKATEVAHEVLKFCEAFQQETNAARTICQAIEKAGLLVERSATFTPNDGEAATLAGFRVIDQAKLDELDDEAFLELRKAGALPIIYSQLLSMGAWSNVVI